MAKLNSTTIPIRLCLLVTDMHIGGVEAVVSFLAKYLDRSLFQITLMCIHLEGENLAALPADIQLVEVKPRSAKLIHLIPALVQCLRQNCPEIVYAHKFENILAAALSRSVGQLEFVLVGCEHSVVDGLGLTWRGRLGRSLGDRMADAIVTVSWAAADQLTRKLRIPKKRIRVIYNPLLSSDYRLQCVISSGHAWLDSPTGPVVVGAGRLVSTKRFDLLLDAMPEVHRCTKARCIIFGDGPELPFLKQKSALLGLGEIVDLPGFTEKFGSCAAKSTVVAQPSISEALPSVLIEALAAGTQVVAADSKGGATRELFSLVSRGKLVPCEDVSSLASAIISSIRSPQTAADFGVLYELFSIEKRVAEHAAMLAGFSVEQPRLGQNGD